VFFALAFPTVLILGMGYLIPGLDETITDPGPLEGLRTIVVMIPPVLATAMAAPALTTLPAAMATYREQGVLKRLSTTPMRPQGVLVVQVIIGVVAFVVAAALALAVFAAAFDWVAPDEPLMVVLSVVLGAAAVFGVGLLIAAVAAKASTANAIGMLTYFPMLFFAGLWTPGPIMPDAVQTIGSYTPLGAASQGIEAAWFAGEVPARQLVVMVVYIAVLYPLAAKLFRWR